MNRTGFLFSSSTAALVLLFSLSFYAAAAPEGTADSIYLNGNIYTVDKAFSKASAMAVKGSKLLYVGDDAEKLEQLKGPQTKTVNLAGKTVIPGLIEGHMHFLRYGERKSMIDIFWKPKEEILEKVAAEAKKLKPGEWIVSRGWNHEVWPDRKWPSKEELDKVAPENPVVLTRADNHSIWANSLALEKAGVDKDTPDPQGGEILKNEKGEVLGVLTDTAMPFVLSKVPPMSAERRYEAYLKAQADLLSYGVTSIMDAGESLENLEILKKAYEKGDMKLRSYEMLLATTNQDVLFIEAGNKPTTGLFGDRLSIAAVKVVSDGSLGSRSAWMLEDYHDRPGHKGNGRYTDDELYAILARAYANGFQIGVHAIGDAAVRQVINQVERVIKANPAKDHRFRIEHFQIVNAQDIPRAIELGIVPAMQAVHATSDMNMAEDRVGPVTIKSSYAWRTVIDCHGEITNGSDAPVEAVNPYHGIYASVTRQDLQGKPEGGWHPEQKMTREEALKSFTIWAAFGQFEDKIKGSLEAGKLADFTVIDRDLMVCPESELKDIQALQTVIGGEVAFERK